MDEHSRDGQALTLSAPFFLEVPHFLATMQIVLPSAPYNVALRPGQECRFSSQFTIGADATIMSDASEASWRRPVER